MRGREFAYNNLTLLALLALLSQSKTGKRCKKKAKAERRELIRRLPSNAKVRAIAGDRRLKTFNAASIIDLSACRLAGASPGPISKLKNMATSYDERSLAFFGVEFPPDLGLRLPDLATKLHESLKPDNVAFRAGQIYTFQWQSIDQIFIINHNKIAWHSLGLKAWRDRLPACSDAVALALDTLGVTTLKRIGFKLVAFRPQAMSHAELGDLFFDSFVGSRDRWTQVIDRPNDPMIQMSGERDSFKVVLHVSAMNCEQAQASFIAMPGLDAFDYPRLASSRIERFYDRLGEGAFLWVDVDLFHEQSAASEAREFIEKSLSAAVETIEKAWRTLQSKPIMERNE
jgi:hypothetical protein